MKKYQVKKRDLSVKVCSYSFCVKSFTCWLFFCAKTREGGLCFFTSSILGSLNYGPTLMPEGTKPLRSFLWILGPEIVPQMIWPEWIWVVSSIPRLQSGSRDFWSFFYFWEEMIPERNFMNVDQFMAKLRWNFISSTEIKELGSDLVFTWRKSLSWIKQFWSRL